MFIELFTTFTTAFGRLRLLGDLRKEGLRDDWVGDLVGDREGTHGLVERMVASEPAYRPSAAEILVMACLCFLMVLVPRNLLIKIFLIRVQEFIQR
jgi:hypothetical protein